MFVQTQSRPTQISLNSITLRLDLPHEKAADFMTDLAQEQAARPGTVPPSPAVVRPQLDKAASDSGRAAARAALTAALSGVPLTGTDLRFLSRLSQWDKRNAATVASLVTRARQCGRSEAGLSPGQLETILAALVDGFAYRTSGAAAEGCWDCANRSSGLCTEHARDADRARDFADLAAALSGQATPTSMPRLGAVPDFRHRDPVAS
jgi:hypothetical protein